MYSVAELRNKLEEKVSALGVNQKFKTNPAYEAVLNNIDSLIGQMNMLEQAQDVTVREEQGNILFNWVSPAGEKYEMLITSPNPETIRCVLSEERKPYSMNGQIIKEKSAIEEIATVDKNNGFVTIFINGSMVDNINCGIGKSNNSTWSERQYFTTEGVMRDREFKTFPSEELTEDIDRARVDSMLNIPRQAYNFGFWHDKYDNRLLLTRETLDTARILSEDRPRGIKYLAATQLNQEHGLRDMTPPMGYDPYPREVIIEPLSKEEIEAMIQREPNPIVAEGLRAYAQGRENYYYNSEADQRFICEGVQSISR